ncbi:hypothetical protein WR25_18452 [Diploscapter pachys]|uniref:Uncharacterized protein n=1 Tax=Diploscapter pachys TaxID=2018661 RepID=A0A2A2K1W9_9BILA|nr:hypothetical protein WR25_18452 [Diploscapter pachys]
MDNFQIMPRLDDGDNKGIPDGALTVLVIAAVAVVSVAVTLLCMLISHRRTLRRRQQSASAVAAAVAVNRPTSMPTSSPLPLYIQQAFDPKFDSPPTYEEAVRIASHARLPDTSIIVPYASTSLSTKFTSSDANDAEFEDRGFIRCKQAVNIFGNTNRAVNVPNFPSNFELYISSGFCA